MTKLKHNMRLLYLDIETTPHAGTFWNLYPKFIPLNQIKEPTAMLCWAAKWEGDREVIFRRWDDPDMVETIHGLLDEADAVVHYNGKSFDIKHLNREFAVQGLSPPSHFHQIDLLSTVRQNFKLASNKLDWVMRYFGLGKKVKHVGIELWYGCMEGKASDWKVMERYNKRDVTLLPKLYKFLLPWIKGHPNAAFYKGTEIDYELKKPVCTNCGSTNLVKKGTQHNTIAASYDRYKCNSCGTPLRARLSSQRTSPHVLRRG